MNLNILDTPPGPNSAKLYTNCITLLTVPGPSDAITVGLGLLKQNDLVNDVTLRKGIMAVKPGSNTIVKLFDDPNGKGTPFKQIRANDPLQCLTQDEKSKIKSISVEKLEGFGLQTTTICGYTLYEIVMVFVLLFVAYLIYQRYIQSSL